MQERLSNIVGALLTDLSNVSDYLNRNLLIAKLAAYGFEHSALVQHHSYLSGRNIVLRLIIHLVHGWIL